mgnify:CR=1 FL=1
MVRGRTFDIVLREIKRHISVILLTVTLMFVGTGVGIVQPLMFKRLIDVAIPAKDSATIIWLLVGMVVAPLLAVGISSTQEYMRAYIGEAISQALRKELFEHLLHVRIPEIEKFKTGEIVYRITRECGRIGEFYVAQQLLPLVSNT